MRRASSSRSRLGQDTCREDPLAAVGERRSHAADTVDAAASKPGFGSNCQERDDGVMWVAIRDWMLADNEPPLPSVGSVLGSVGVRASGTVAVAKPDAADAINEIGTTADPVPQFVEYVFVGATGPARDVNFHVDGRGRHSGAEFVLSVNELRFQVRFDGRARERTRWIACGGAWAAEPGRRIRVGRVPTC